MKFSKYIAGAVIASMLATTAFAGSIGRSSSSGSRSSSSFSKPSSPSKSYSAPSAPAKSAPMAAPAPSKPGGIGGTASSVGVRKSEVTAPVQNQVAQSKPGGTTGVGSTGSSTASGYSSPAPSYGSANVPSYGGSGYAAPSPGLGAGGVFASSLGGSLVGSMIGNSLFGHSNHGSGTTVINNGTPSGGVVSSGATGTAPQSVVNSDGTVITSSGFVQPKKEYTVWSFIADLIGFVFVVAILLGIAWLFYKGFQIVRAYVNKERGVSNIPFNPTQQFWTIQKAFASADVTALQTLLGPDVVDELTNDLQASTLTLHNVSHEVRLANTTEFSIWYKFEDDGAEVNQVWHYEKFGKDWKLNGIENV